MINLVQASNLLRAQSDNAILFAGIALALLSYVCLSRSANRQAAQLSLPPGNLGLPFLGETFQFLQSLVNNKPWEFYLSREAKYGKLYKTSLFGSPVVVFSPPQGNKFLFTNHNKVIGMSWPIPISKLFPDNALLHSDGDQSKGFRQVLMGFLGPDAMQRYAGGTSSLIQAQLQNHWKAGEVVYTYPLIKQCLFSVVCNMFLSLTSDEEKMELMEPFERVIHGMLSVPIDFPGTTFRKAKFGREEIFKILDKHIATRKLQLEQGLVSPVQDLLSVLLTTVKEDEGKIMTDKEIKDNILGLLVAGHETTSSSLSMTIKCLGENPECYKEVKRIHLEIAASKKPGEPLNWEDLKKMKYSWMVIQETMRLKPTAAGMFRQALVDFEIDGYTIPKGWQLFCTVYSSHTSELFFRDAKKFDPLRFKDNGPRPYTYFPFGGGPRICAGIEQVKMQNLTFLHHLITTFDWELVEPDEPIKLVPVAIPANNLPLRLTKSTPY